MPRAEGGRLPFLLLIPKSKKNHSGFDTVYLKHQNNVRVLAVLAGNVVVFLAIVGGEAGISGELSSWKEYVTQLIPVALGVAVSTILNGLLAPGVKAQIVFWRVQDPLPGSRAFSELASTDPRLNEQVLQSKFGPLPTEGKAQNALWYELYQTVKSDPMISGAHKDFLFARDYTSLSLLMIPVLIFSACLAAIDYGLLIVYTALLLLQYFLARLAAEHYGNRFVTNVLALVSSK